MNNKILPLTIVGHIVEIESAIQGETWIKQNFTIRTLGDYPKLVNFTTFNTAQDQLSRCKIADEVTVYFNPESKLFEKENTRRFFTELIAWKVVINFKTT
jgi:hypothetical protein